MPIEDRNVQAGTTLVARYKGQEHRAEVVKTDDGLRYEVAGEGYKSPSAAGKAVTGNACNGWVFWSLEGQEPQPKRVAKKANRNGNGNGLIRRLDDGRYFCSACQEPFTAPKGVEPQGCPKGHTVDGEAS
jgi:hypothetical protein